MADDFDLFGNPLEPNGETRGRPEHKPTEENIIFIMVLLAAGATSKEAAETLGISVPTFKKHYFHLIKKRDLMLDRLRTKLRVTQIQKGLDGNAAALNAALATLDRVRAEKADRSIKSRPGKAPLQKLGKKEERHIAAREMTGKFAPPSGPKLIVNNQ